MNPYNPEAYNILDQCLQETDAFGPVFIFGTGLTADDQLVSIYNRCQALERELPHVIKCSRRGLEYPGYSINHVHKRLHIDRPAFMDRPNLTLADLEEAIPAWWNNACDQILEQDPDTPREQLG